MSPLGAAGDRARARRGLPCTRGRRTERGAGAPRAARRHGRRGRERFGDGRKPERGARAARRGRASLAGLRPHPGVRLARHRARPVRCRARGDRQAVAEGRDPGGHRARPLSPALNRPVCGHFLGQEPRGAWLLCVLPSGGGGAHFGPQSHQGRVKAASCTERRMCNRERAAVAVPTRDPTMSSTSAPPATPTQARRALPARVQRGAIGREPTELERLAEVRGLQMTRTRRAARSPRGPLSALHGTRTRAREGHPS